jgi:phosphinothricin acetyltransferase
VGPSAIRAATAADAPSVTDIYAEHVRTGVATFDLEPPDAAFWRAKIEDVGAAGWPFLVAVTGSAVAGFAYASQWRPKPGYRHTVEDTLYLRPDAVGRGNGRTLLRALLDACAEAGAREVLAVIADSGDPASFALHRSLGFREVGRLSRVGVKFGREIDTVLVQRSLDGDVPTKAW